MRRAPRPSAPRSCRSARDPPPSFGSARAGCIPSPPWRARSALARADHRQDPRRGPSPPAPSPARSRAGRAGTTAMPDRGFVLVGRCADRHPSRAGRRRPCDPDAGHGAVGRCGRRPRLRVAPARPTGLGRPRLPPSDPPPRSGPAWEASSSIGPRGFVARFGGEGRLMARAPFGCGCCGGGLDGLLLAARRPAERLRSGPGVGRRALVAAVRPRPLLQRRPRERNPLALSARASSRLRLNPAAGDPR